MEVLRFFLLAFALFLQGNLVKSRYTVGRLYHMKSGDLSLRETSRKVVKQDDERIVCECVAHIYEHPDFRGRCLTIRDQNANFANDYFNDRADSIKIVGKCKYILYEHCNFRGAAYVIDEGKNFSSIARWRGPTDRISSARALPPQKSDAIVLFEHCNYQGRMLVLTASNDNLHMSSQFDNKVSSIIVTGGTWKIYEHPNYGGDSREIRGKTESRNIHRKYQFGDIISSVQLVRNSLRTMEAAKNEESDDDEDWNSDY